jgi:hypothetical protein
MIRGGHAPSAGADSDRFGAEVVDAYDGARYLTPEKMKRLKAAQALAKAGQRTAERGHDDRCWKCNGGR